MATQIRSFFLALFLFAATLVPQLAVAQQFTVRAKLVGTGFALPTPQQGYSVAVSGDGNTALVGDGLDNSAWVFSFSSLGWTQQVQLSVPNTNLPNSVALSSNGNTAIVGTPGYSSSTGAAWVYTRSNGVWTQQGSSPLVATAVTSLFGASVALSSDGNTALVGEPGNNVGVGGAWVFTRSNGVWKQLGGVLVGTNPMSFPLQGSSVALSGDGFTALIGGPGDNGNTGATWVFTRSNTGVWTQKAKLIGTGTSNPAEQGMSVALSTHGTTAIVGGPTASGGGAAWVFTLVRGGWVQQGGPLGGSGSGGRGVALSGDGNTAIVGSPDNPITGAVRAYTRNTRGLWTQLGSVITVTPASTNSFGFSVSLDALGRTLLIGGPADSSEIGAAWVYVRPLN
jgi:hypothetical protein